MFWIQFFDRFQGVSVEFEKVSGSLLRAGFLAGQAQI